MSDLEGAMLSDYLLLQCIHKGGVADVYRARPITGESTENAADVAVKIFRSTYAQRTTFRDFFMTEADKIGQFDHPNILSFLEYGEGDNLLYFVTPYITHGTLDVLLRRVGGRFSAIQALPIVQQLCSAVQYAHDHGVAHGNIKPSNVFVASDGRMLLSDFGIARGFDDSQQSLTRVGWGSAEYAAPEQSLGVLRPPSDIYSLGVLIYYILTGSPPFTGQTPVEVLLKHVRQTPPSARTLVPQISTAVDMVLAKALRKRSDERFTSIEELSHFYTQAVMLSPGAFPVARPFTTGKLVAQDPGQMTSLEAPITPGLILSSRDGRYPQTPLPAMSGAASTWTPPPSETPLPEFEIPVWRHEKSYVEDIKNAIGLDVRAGIAGEGVSSHVLSVDPVEWSPIAENEKTTPNVPMGASDYLDKKAAVSEIQTLAQRAEGEKKETFQARFWKWLPILVVILLLIGLLGAILSVFFYPGNSSGASLSHYLLFIHSEMGNVMSLGL